MSEARPATPGDTAIRADSGTRDYRPDIDGLRAIAVFSVVAYHAGIGLLPGGFVGVDIFFVISGYLIGGQIARGIATGTFSYVDFYARRARRILPALFFLLAAMLLLGLFLFTPPELEELAKEGVATIFGLSNMLFWHGQGYFDPTAEFSPLLMTWSLGVEEQFYLLFPAVLMILARWRAATFPVLVAITLLSLLASLAATHFDRQIAFYLLPPRAWELGAGVLIALWPARAEGARVSGLLCNAGAVAAFAMLLVSLVAYRSIYPFPGHYALLPVVATAVLIATRASLLNRAILALPVMTFLGKVSYSWYLWHWPIFYLDRLLGLAAPPAVLILLSLGLGFLSWRFVEQPFRRRLLPPAKVLALYAIAAFALAGVFVAAYAMHGLPVRLPAAGQKADAEARSARDDRCQARFGVRAPDLAGCAPAAGTAHGRLVLLGDSHASAFAPAFREMARGSGMAFAQFTKSSCPGFWNASRDLAERSGHWRECIAFQYAAFRYIETHPDVRTVVLAGFWSGSTDLQSRAGTGREAISLSDALRSTVARLRAAGKSVVLVQDAPILEFDPFARVVGDEMPLRRLLTGGTGDQGYVAAPRDIRGDPSRAMLVSIAAQFPGTTIADPRAGLCDAAGCRYAGADGLYYFDIQHLTAVGARRALTSVGHAPNPGGKK